MRSEKIGMNSVRGLGRIAGLGSLLALSLLLLAPGFSALLDRGPDGSARLSVFPIALAIFDPFVRECARNSAVVAGLVAGLSMVLGVGLGHAAGPRRTWGRPPMVLLSRTPMAAGPLLIAPGVWLVMGGPGGWEWLSARSLLGWSAEDLARWSALVWVGLAWGAPMVALATESALRRVEPSWLEAARAAGASPARAWRDVVWPALRPEASRAAATVFTLALAEPAGPMVLGLRRTLAIQILGAASRLDQPTRAATVALIAILIALVARAAILRWGGPSILGPGSGPSFPPTPAGRGRGMASLLALAAWSCFAAGPVAALLWRLTDPVRGATAGQWSSLLVGWLAEPGVSDWAANALMVGGIAVGLDFLILPAIHGRGPMAGNGPARLIVRGFEAIPPMALAVGAMALPWLIGAAADRAGGSVGHGLRALARELSPARSPGFLLVAAVACGRLPTLVRAADLARDRSRPVLADAALLMGASRRRARRAAQNRWLGIVPARPLILSMALASTSLAPALLLAPGSERRTLAPAVLEGLLGSESPDPRWLGPIVALLLVNGVGFAMASRGRSGSLGDWFRG
jgi:ABC-type Fe3+ transport system permease subunit